MKVSAVYIANVADTSTTLYCIYIPFLRAPEPMSAFISGADEKREKFTAAFDLPLARVIVRRYHLVCARKRCK